MRTGSVFAAVVVTMVTGIVGSPGAAAPVAAGAWAVVSLDEMPDLRAGQAVEIGFTVRRHGVTLENSEEFGEMTVVLAGPSGSQRFEVEQEGSLGHHVAIIEVPDAGEYSWKVTGPFMDVELGRVAVAASGDGGVSWLWTAVPIGGGLTAVGLAALAVSDGLRSRRRLMPVPV
ncbi:hypothetical protein BH24ACT5_BH24ACT5_19430 [soil metagenome]